MHKFISLLKKESLVFLTGCSAYFLIFIYLFCSAGGAFYFGDYLTAKDSSLYSLFSLQPYILAIVIPAITMKSWAEEYKSNTAEFLLTLPVSLSKLVWTKFFAASLFAMVMSLGLLPFIIYSSYWLELDRLNILSSYLGLELMILLFCAFGCFVSSLSKNLIITYALSIFFLLVGIIVTQTEIMAVYRNFLFGEIGIFEIFYNLSFTVLFLFANLLIIKYRRNIYKNSRLGLMFFILLMMAVNSAICWSISIFDYKADFTSGGFYTLKRPTKQIIKQISRPIQINLFMAEDYFKRDKSAAHYFEQINRFLNKYQSLSKGMIKLSPQLVEAFSEQENTLIEKGFYYVKNTKGSKNYFGAIIDNNEGSEEVITMFLQQRISYLEEDIDRAILKTAFPELKKSVGVYFDGEQNLDDFEAATLVLENEYNVALLDNSTYQIRKNAEAVVLFNPKVLSPVFTYALDQYVVNGGNLLIFVDRNTENQLDAVNEQPLSILRLLNNWKIKLGEDSFDNGEAVGKFSNSNKKLSLHSAFAVEVEDENLEVTELITEKDKLIGMIAKGKFHSFYQENPFAETVIAPQMRPFKAKGKTGQVAVIGDADILNETNWIRENSPDRDIYGTIEKAGNGRLFRAVVDYLVGNNIYAFLPKNDFSGNEESIAEKINREIIAQTENQYQKLEEEASGLYLKIWQISDYDEEKIPEILDLTDVGRKLQSLTEQMNGIEYERTNKYNTFIRYLMLWFMMIVPLIEVLLTMILVFLIACRKNKSIKELSK